MVKVQSGKGSEGQSGKGSERKVKTFRDLFVWKKSMALVVEIYQESKLFPAEEQFGLIAQIRRSATSIPCNIAEGFGRKTTQDYLRFLYMAAGSHYELQTQLEISFNLNFLDKDKFDKLNDSTKEIERMLSSLIKKLNARSSL